jgi:hypothetical protein
MKRRDGNIDLRAATYGKTSLVVSEGEVNVPSYNSINFNSHVHVVIIEVKGRWLDER